MARIPRRDHTNSHSDVEILEKCLGRTPLAHVSVCVCCFSYQIFRKIGGKSKPQTVFLLFSNPLRSDKILESKVGCSVILVLEMSPCPAEVSAVMEVPLSLLTQPVCDTSVVPGEEDPCLLSPSAWLCWCQCNKWSTDSFPNNPCSVPRCSTFHG